MNSINNIVKLQIARKIIDPLTFKIEEGSLMTSTDQIYGVIVFNSCHYCFI